MDKMITRGRLSIHLQKASQLSKEWGEGHKAKVKVFHKEGYLQAKTSRISAGARVTRHAVPDYYEVLEDCPSWGAKEKDIQAWYNGTYEKPRTHKEKIERIKKRGLPLFLGINTN